MSKFRKPSKIERLWSMFPNIYDTHTLEEVYEFTEINNYKNLRSDCQYLRRGKYTPKESRVNLIIKGQLIIREPMPKE